MAEGQKHAKGLHIKSPLVKSFEISSRHPYDVYLKLDNIQIPGSFKIRGIGHLCSQMAAQRSDVNFVSSSGGNAGLAASYAGHVLGKPVHVFVPSTTPQTMIDLMKGYNATVTVSGSVWNEANEAAVAYCQANNGGVLAHPYEHPLIWEGHSTVVDEIYEDLGRRRPAAIVCCVGGGGLLLGVMTGLSRYPDWKDVPIIAMETHGANCLSQGLKAGKVVRLPAITSVAKSLGSLVICEEVLKRAPQFTLISREVSDEQVLSACHQFARDHRYVVEPACGATLSAVYNNVIESLCDEGILPKNLSGPVVLLVCGGANTIGLPYS